ncbi:MAG: DNA polymerase III subunit delta [Patescibacteria group bacterium]
MILFLHGADTYRARQKLKEIQAKYQTTYFGAVHITEFDCAEANVEDAKNALETISLFESKKLLIFQNVFVKKEFEEFLFERRKQLAESARHIVVLFEREEIKAKGTNKFYQWLCKNAKHQEFVLLPPAQLKAWIEQEFLRYHLKATSRVREMLARAVGNNLWQLSCEIKKIAAWKGSSTDSQVLESDIALLVPSRAEADVFSTIEAAAQKNKKQAFRLLYDHLQKGDSPYYLFSMFVYQFRTILQIQDLVERKLSLAAMLQKTKLHPYILKKGLRVAQNFSLQELKALYEKLFLLDKNLKTGKIAPEGVFDLLIAQL